MNSQHSYSQTSSVESVIDVFCVKQEPITTNVSGKPIGQSDYTVKITVLIGTRLEQTETSMKCECVCVSECVFTCRRAVGHGDVSAQVSSGVAAVEESRKCHNCGFTDTWRDGERQHYNSSLFITSCSAAVPQSFCPFHRSL